MSIESQIFYEVRRGPMGINEAWIPCGEDVRDDYSQSLREEIERALETGIRPGEVYKAMTGPLQTGDNFTLNT